MKKINYIVKSLMVGALAFALSGLANCAKADDVNQVISVLKVMGSARYSTDNKTWQPLRVGDVLRQGAVIQTAEDSSVDLATSDDAIVPTAQPVNAAYPGKAANYIGGAGLVAASNAGPKPNVLHLFPSTILAVDKLLKERTGVDEVTDTQLDLRAGRVLGDVKKLSANSRYEIKIPTGVAGIRGTTYTVNAQGVIFVLTGSVTITYIDSTNTPQTVTVTAGNAFNPFQDPVTGRVSTSSGPGKITPIPPATLAALQAANPNPTGPSSYTKNGTTVYISPN